MDKLRPNLLKCICFFCFVLIFCSCSPLHTGGKAVATATSTNHPSASSTPTLAPITMADCPPANTAHAAIMPGMTLGTHPNIFYETMVPGPTGGTLPAIQHYDVTTGQTTEVIALLDQALMEAGESILSNDGQWIIFYGLVGMQQYGIQMVRVDGQDFQTLYCGSAGNLLLSPDQKTLAFMSSGNLEMLDMSSGKLQTDYVAPKDSSGMPIYCTPMEWQTNTSLFVKVGGPGEITPEIDLVKDTTLDSNSQATNFQQVLPRGSRDVDINQNQILSSSVTMKTGVETGPSRITIQTLDGNVSTVYTDPNSVIMYAHFVSRTKIAFFAEDTPIDTNNIGGPPKLKNVGIWTINTDGTGLTQIAAFPDDSELAPLLMVSRDGSQYLVDVTSVSSQSPAVESLFFGKLQGTEASPMPGNFAPGSLSPIGWSTF